MKYICTKFFLGSHPFRAFFESLYKCLARGARAVLQVYPENVHQRELILGFAMRAGFAGGVVVDYPHRYMFNLFEMNVYRETLFKIYLHCLLLISSFFSPLCFYGPLVKLYVNRICSIGCCL